MNKMSKSLGNYIGITDSANDIFGKVMSISDELMFRYFELLSDLSRDEITKLQARLEKGELHPKEVKQMLARELTARFHSEDAALQGTIGYALTDMQYRQMKKSGCRNFWLKQNLFLLHLKEEG